MAFLFVTGATGFLGSNLLPTLLERGHAVRALVRSGSETRVPAGCEVTTGNPIDGTTYRSQVAPADTFVHLVGVSHPSPAKAAEFRRIDLGSALAAVEAARFSGTRHFIYVSVAHPAPVMKEYIQARSEAEDAIRASGLNATILRPWYILGPRRCWPLVLLPVYWLMQTLPFARESARRLGLVTIGQMVAAIVTAVEHPPQGERVLEVPEIRASRLSRSR